ncbi:hypothetical protein DSECCO2_25670 [anaerobic digester metagenome]
MATYVIKSAAGEIEMWNAQPFPGSTLVDYEVVRGWDGRPYKAGEVPAPPLSEVQAAKRAEINAGFDAALTASLTMPSRTDPPSAVELALAIEDFKSDDPTGLGDLRAIHEARRTALLAAVDAATTIAEVQAISVTYAV